MFIKNKPQIGYAITWSFRATFTVKQDMHQNIANTSLMHMGGIISRQKHRKQVNIKFNIFFQQ